jgi:membrane protease subunit (stomatin/prohibitin family)
MKLLSNYDELATVISEKTKGEFDEYGIEVLNLLVENISLPEDQQETLKKRMAMQTLGNVNTDLRAYTQFQTAQSLPEAAKNPGGLAAAGVGLGMGMGMAGQMNQAYAGPPPLPSAAAVWYVALAGQQAGPFDGAALQGHIAAGRLTRESLVWKNGMPGWSAASQVPELASLFGNVPPPLPK